MKENRLFIGCSGYYYPHWKKGLYPEAASNSELLRYYSLAFNTVELNSPFYNIPKLANLKKQYDACPKGFRFSVKMHRSVTHYKKMKDCRDDISAFMNLMQKGLSDKLACILFQFPPSFHFSKENLNLILSNVPGGPEQVIEFRHESWWNGEVRKSLAEKQLTFCNVDYPGLKTRITNEGEVFYLRLHGTPELFKSSYSNRELQHFAKYVRPDNETFIYFNNTFNDAAWRNAHEMLSLLRQ